MHRTPIVVIPIEQKSDVLAISLLPDLINEGTERVE